MKRLLAFLLVLILAQPAYAQTSIFNGGTGARTPKGARDNLNVMSSADLTASLLGYLKLAGRTADQVVLGIATTNIPLSVQGKAGQTASIFVVENSSGTDLVEVDASGRMLFDDVTAASTFNVQMGQGNHFVLGDAGTGGRLQMSSSASAYTFLFDGAGGATQFLRTTGNYTVQGAGVVTAERGALDVLNMTAARTVASFRGPSGQTGPLTSWRDPTEVPLAWVMSSGRLWTPGLTLEDSTAGTNTITIRAPAAPTTHSLTLPGANAAGALTNDGAGALSWGAIPIGSLPAHNHSSSSQGGAHLKPWASSVDSIPLVVTGQPSQRNKYVQVSDQTAAAKYPVFEVSPGTPADSTLTTSSYLKLGRPDTGRFWWMKGGTTPDFRLDNISGNSRTLLVLNSVATYWTDTKETIEFRIGESISSRKDAAIIGNAGNAFDRLAVSSLYTIFTRDVTAALVTPSASEIVRIYNGTSAGTDAAVPLRVESARSGQTGHLVDFATSGGVASGIDSTGRYFQRAAGATGRVLVSDAGGYGTWTALSSTYTPTLTNGVNVQASTAYSCQWMRVGNTVTVSGKIDVDATNPSLETNVDVSLPVASNFAADQNCSGTVSGVNFEIGYVNGDVTNDRAQVIFASVVTTNGAIFFHFTYQVI